MQRSQMSQIMLTSRYYLQVPVPYGSRAQANLAMQAAELKVLIHLMTAMILP